MGNRPDAVILVDYEVQGLSNGFLPVFFCVFFCEFLFAFLLARTLSAIVSESDSQVWSQRSELHDYSAWRLIFCRRYLSIPFHVSVVLVAVKCSL